MGERNKKNPLSRPADWSCLFFTFKNIAHIEFASLLPKILGIYTIIYNNNYYFCQQTENGPQGVHNGDINMNK